MGPRVYGLVLGPCGAPSECLLDDGDVLELPWAVEEPGLARGGGGVPAWGWPRAWRNLDSSQGRKRALEVLGVGEEECPLA